MKCGMEGEETGIERTDWMRVLKKLSCVTGPVSRLGIHARRTVEALPEKTKEAAGRRKRKFTEV
jgi:hypothetical protein